MAIRTFTNHGPYNHHAATITTGILVILTAIWLFLRIAGHSWHHEPPKWRRDLWLTTTLTAITTATALLWPQDIPHFWGGRTFQNPDGTGGFTEHALPGLGWWSMIIATILLAIAAWRAREQQPKD